ncbi:MAG: prepilin-type N-terminal cleavage/methylation domain-containing protein [Patescibacteria group bacterium]|nr:prepilin-type N-terminal cleavage/methylation domain-containing protein [Patescibacteria group bacterium]
MNKGFTLIEMLVAIAIFGLISGALFSLIPFLYKTNNYAWNQAYAIDEARRGVKVMVREIREARAGGDGSYIIEKAEDSEFIFFSDIDNDGDIERVRYFLGGVSNKEETEDCVSNITGGSCSVVFSDFYEGILEQAQVQISIEGDFGWVREFSEIFVDGISLGELCDSQGECSDCSGFWQSTISFDVTEQAQDNFLQFIADASKKVDNFCNWQEPGHSMKAQFILSWTETTTGQDMEFKRGVINPIEDPPVYLSDQEEVEVLSVYVQNKLSDPEKYVFRYFDENGEEIIEYPARPEETRLMQVSLIINVEPDYDPGDYTLESKVQLRNLKMGED